MVTVKPLSGAHPGFAPLAPTAIASVQTSSKSVKVNNQTVDAIAIKFNDGSGRCFAEMNSARNDFGWIRLAKADNQPIGSLIASETTLKFPAKGVLRSEPVGDVIKSASGREYRRHNVILEGVELADLIAN
jgi:hypothetical protein